MSQTAAIGRGAPRPRAAAREAGLTAGGRPRHAEFDALRGTACLLVVTVHAALGYTQLDIPRLLWGVREPSPHRGFDLFAWWLMGVSVSLFFAISGFFAAELYEAKGPAGFLEGRVRRILVPFLAASATILPLCFLAWSCGWIVTGRADFSEFRRMRFLDPAIMAELYGPAHLWFLEYLLIMLAGFVVVRTLRGPRRPEIAPSEDSPAGQRLLAVWAPLVLAIPTSLLMKLGRDRVGIDVMLDRHNSFVPDPVRLLHYATFFAFGLGLHRARGRLDALAERAPWYLLATAPIYAARAWLLPRDWASPLAEPWATALAVSGGLFAWLNVFGFIGLYRRLFARPSRLARDLADRSYWLYLIHLPIVGLAQADLYPTRLPTTAKFALVWSATLFLGLASYQLLFRRAVRKQSMAGGVHPTGLTAKGLHLSSSGVSRGRSWPVGSGRGRGPRP